MKKLFFFFMIHVYEFINFVFKRSKIYVFTFVSALSIY